MISSNTLVNNLSDSPKIKSDKYIQIIESLDNVLKFINSDDAKDQHEALIVIQSFVQMFNNSMLKHLNETSIQKLFNILKSGDNEINEICKNNLIFIMKSQSAKFVWEKIIVGFGAQNRKVIDFLLDLLNETIQIIQIDQSMNYEFLIVVKKLELQFCNDLIMVNKIKAIKSQLNNLNKRDELENLKEKLNEIKINKNQIKKRLFELKNEYDILFDENMNLKSELENLKQKEIAKSKIINFNLQKDQIIESQLEYEKDDFSNLSNHSTLNVNNCKIHTKNSYQIKYRKDKTLNDELTCVNANFELIEKDIYIDRHDNLLEYIPLFKNKIEKLTGQTYVCNQFGRPNLDQLLKIFYVCHYQSFRSRCKSKVVIVLDLKTNLANIYKNAEQHNHSFFKGGLRNQLNFSLIKKNKINNRLNLNLLSRLGRNRSHQLCFPIIVDEEVNCNECKSSSDYRELFKKKITEKLGHYWVLNQKPRFEDKTKFLFYCSKRTRKSCNCKCSVILDSKTNMAYIYRNSDDHNHRFDCQ